jgi:hypothetical protein
MCSWENMGSYAEYGIYIGTTLLKRVRENVGPK